MSAEAIKIKADIAMVLATGLLGVWLILLLIRNKRTEISEFT